MYGKDGIVFTGKHRDFCLGVSFDLQGKGPADAAAALGYVSEKIEPHAYRFSGINTGAIEKLAAEAGKGVAGAAAFFEGIPPGELRQKLLAAVPKPELYPAAESYLLNRVLAAAGVRFKVPPQPGMKPADEEISDFIGFMGKYGEWVAVKKLGMESVQDYEVSGILSGINNTIVNKAFDFAGWRSGAGNAAGATKRKSFGNLAQSLHGLEGAVTGAPDDAFRACLKLGEAGFKPYASPEMLTEAYPDIKPPKSRGRKPKG
jgi:hypothetical protein